MALAALTNTRQHTTQTIHDGTAASEAARRGLFIPNERVSADSAAGSAKMEQQGHRDDAAGMVHALAGMLFDAEVGIYLYS